MIDLSTLDVAQLESLAAQVRAELTARALERGDLAAIAEQEFARAESARGALTPRIVSGLLVCPGRLASRGTGHACSFTAVDLDGDQDWCWERDEVAYDEVRRHTGGLSTVTLLPVVEGAVVTQVDAKLRGGGHTRTGARSWRVADGVLAVTSTASVRGHGHRDDTR